MESNSGVSPRSALLCSMAIFLMSSCDRTVPVEKEAAISLADRYIAEKYQFSADERGEGGAFKVRNAWLISYYLPRDRYCGKIDVLVADTSGEVLIAYPPKHELKGGCPLSDPTVNE